MSTFDNGRAVWFLMRGTGVVSLMLLTAVLALGIATQGGVTLGSLPRFATLALHRAVALMSLVFVGVHVVTAVVDPYATVSLVDVAVPFAASSQPLMVGLGAIALELIVALAVTGALRDRIGRRTWRGIHWAGYATWPIALVHACGMGSDTGTLWLRAAGLASIAVVAAAVAWRLTREPAAVATAAAR